MDKVLIILKKESVIVYDIEDGKAKIHTIHAEKETDIEDYAEVASSLRDSYNDDELEDVEADVVYTSADTRIIKEFTEELLPCGAWQVFSFKKLLPEILLKTGLLKPNASVSVKYDGEAYTASMTRGGKIKLDAAKNGQELKDTDIAAVYADNFSVFTDEEQRGEQLRQINSLSEELGKLGQENQKQSDKIEQIQKEMNDKLKAANSELENTKLELEKSEKLKKELLAGRRIPIFGDGSGKLKWTRKNGEKVKEGQRIAETQRPTGTLGESFLWSMTSWYVLAPADGVLVHVKEDGYEMNGKIIGVIMHEGDSEWEACKWAETKKAKDMDETMKKLNDLGINLTGILGGFLNEQK